MSTEADKVYTPSNTAIPRIPVKELIKDMLLQSSILAFIDFEELMIANPNFSYFEVMSRMVRLALERHERVCPLYKRSTIYINGNSYEFRDNFKAFLDGKVTENYVTLIPKVSPYSLDTSLLHTRRAWTYNKPIMNNVYNLGIVDIDYIASYPVIMKEDKESKDFTDDSNIYYMSMYGGTSSDGMFKRQFYYQVLNYLKGVKNNLRYPDMPIELLQGIEEEYQILQSELQEFYRRVNSHGRLYR
jgi:hypothetical protein